MISEGRIKKSHYFCHFWIILVFLWRESAKSVLWCSRCKIHLSDAPNELCRIPMCYATSQWATPHPNELRHTPMSYAISQWATPHPNKLRHIPMSCATFQWARPHSNELRHIQMSYATFLWATPRPHPSVNSHYSLWFIKLINVWWQFKRISNVFGYFVRVNNQRPFCSFLSTTVYRSEFADLLTFFKSHLFMYMWESRFPTIV